MMKSYFLHSLPRHFERRRTFDGRGRFRWKSLPRGQRRRNGFHRNLPNVFTGIRTGFRSSYQSRSLSTFISNPRVRKKIEKVFTYDWRMWSIPELREMMRETGFRKTRVYWEGTARNGEGNGRCSASVDKGEECEAWIAYVIGERYRYQVPISGSGAAKDFRPFAAPRMGDTAGRRRGVARLARLLF